MPAFGERLKRERESHDTTIEQIAAASGIGQSYLEALERDDFIALPGPAFGKLYIRAYAEVLGFDPQPWIDDYDRERRAAMAVSVEPPSPEPARPRPVGEALALWREARIRERDAPPLAVAPVETTPVEPAPVEAAPIEVAPVEAAPVEAAAVEAVPVEAVPVEAAPVEVVPVEVVPSELAADEPTQPASAPTRPIRESAPGPATVSRSRWPVAVFVAALLVAGAAAAYLAFFRPSNEDHAPIAIERPESPPVESSHAPLPTPSPAPAARPPSTPNSEAPVTRSATGSAWTVTESGVGRRIVNLRLEGEADTFPEGSRVCFSSRVIGGRSGAILRHVWMRDGRIEQSIPLRLGGPDWRTHSNKTLGRPGAWSVEARDEDGRVLASASFACVPVGR